MNVWTIRSCAKCGRGVKCEPDYPEDIEVVCGSCIRKMTELQGDETIPVRHAIRRHGRRRFWRGRSGPTQ